MDLGATVCTPKKPNCPVCPVAKMCAALGEGAPERYPVKPEKQATPVRFGSAFVLVRGGKVLLVRRPPRGLLGGMMMPPTSDWTVRKATDALAAAPAKATWERVGEVRHVFTHFSLKLDVFRADAPARGKINGEWLGFDDALAALPTAGRKAVALAAGLTKARGVS